MNRCFIVPVWIACLLMAAATRSEGQVSTYFMDKHGTFNGQGAYWYQGFTLGAQRTLVFRFVSDYSCDAAIVTPSQLSNFTSNQAFSGYGLFSSQIGTKTVTLPAGQYYLCARSRSQGSNTYRMELDYDIQVPKDANHTYSFVDNYIGESRKVSPNGGYLTHGFTIQAGFRYFLDGCNTGLATYIIPGDQLANFRSDQRFTYYTDYSGTDNALPGLSEIKLPPGTYYLAFRNRNSISKPVTYTMERWRQVATPIGGKLDLSGTASWQVSGRAVDIRVGKVSNLATSGRSGSLRLRLWATRSKYSGGSISGYVLGLRRLNPLPGGYSYNSVSGQVLFTRPPSGTYYTTITLEEYTPAGWVVRDHINFRGTSRF